MSTTITSSQMQFKNHKVFHYTLAGRPLTLETGKVAGLANGSVMVHYGDTCVLCCATASAAPRDGIVDTKSDTVAAYNAAGTSAASVHSGGDRRRVYAYFEEKYLPYLTEGDTARYRCNHTGEYLELKMFEVDRSRQNHGEKTFYTVKFDVVSPATHIRLEANGVVEYPVKKR